MLFLLDKSSRYTIHDNILRFTLTICNQYYVKMIVLFNCRQVFSIICCAPMFLFNKFLHYCLVWNVCYVLKWNLCLIQFATVFLQLSDLYYNFIFIPIQNCICMNLWCFLHLVDDCNWWLYRHRMCRVELRLHLHPYI